jgi:hypothetical protein
MENAPRLDDAVFVMLGQHRHWRDVRHLKTLVWMVVGLLLSRNISLTDWLDYVCAVDSANVVRVATDAIGAGDGYESVVEPLLSDSDFAGLSRTSDSADVEGDSSQKQ